MLIIKQAIAPPIPYARWPRDRITALKTPIKKKKAEEHTAAQFWLAAKQELWRFPALEVPD